MSLNIACLENFAVLVVEEVDDRFVAKMGRILGVSQNGDLPVYRVGFADGEEGMISRGNFKVYLRYCDEANKVRVLREKRGLDSLRDDYCELNECQNYDFCREYGKLFFS